VIFGFGGYDITDDGLKKIDTVIPKQWTKLTIKGFLNSTQSNLHDDLGETF